MRVIAGIARSMPLQAPEGLDTRPTTDRIKETLFNMLQTQIQGSVFIDVFSGSGGIGIESLSRGAKKAYFIDNSSKAIACIDKNLTFTKLKDKAVVLKMDAVAALSQINEGEADIIFIDPPYKEDQEYRILQCLAAKSYVTEDTLIIIEATLRKDLDFLEELGFELVKEKRYKTNKHLYIKRKEDIA